MKVLSKVIIFYILTAMHSIAFCKNMDVKHLSNTCYMEAAIHALSKIDEMNYKLRACPNLIPGSIPSLYIKLIDKIKDNWSDGKKVFMGPDEIEPRFTLEYFYKKLANEYDKNAGRYGSFKDSRYGAIDPILNEINKICPEATEDLSVEFITQSENNFIALPKSFDYNLFSLSTYAIQQGLEEYLKLSNLLFLKIPKIISVSFNWQPEEKTLADTLLIKKDLIAPDIEFNREDRSTTKLDPKTKKLKDLNCDIPYELFAIGTNQTDFHWWVYAKDSGPNGKWYKYDNFRDSSGEVKEFSSLKDIEADFAANDYPMFFFYRRKPILPEELLLQLKTSLQELQAKLQTLQVKLGVLRGKLK